MSEAFPWKRRSLATAASLVMIGGLGGCGAGGALDAGGPNGCPNKPISHLTIPYLASTTGAAASYAADGTDWAKVALKNSERILGSKLPKITIDQRDSQAKPAQAVSNYHQVLSSQSATPLVMAGLSAEAAPLAPIANRDGIPLVITVSSDTSLSSKNRPWVFNAATSYPAVEKSGVEAWLKKVGNVSTIAYIGDNSIPPIVDEAAGAQSGAEAAGAKVLQTVSFQTGETDFSAIVRKALVGHPGGVIVGGLSPDAASVVREVQRQSPGTRMFLLQAALTSSLYSSAGSALNGAYAATVFFPDDPSPEVQRNVRAFAAIAGQQPGERVTYDAWMLALDAVAKAKLNECMDASEARAGVRDALLHATAPGVDGKPISFNNDGWIPDEGLILLRVDNGKPHKVTG